MRVREQFMLLSVISLVSVLGISIYWTPILWTLIVVVPLFFMGWYDALQTRHTIRRNFPLLGRFRYALESIRPEIMQYFVETDTEGRPLNRIFRSLIYQRSKKVNDTTTTAKEMQKTK